MSKAPDGVDPKASSSGSVLGFERPLCSRGKGHCGFVTGWGFGRGGPSRVDGRGGQEVTVV